MTYKLNRAVVKGSFILIIAFGLYNFLHFLFQFFMARMLTISDYGVLATLFSVVYISAILTESVQNVVVKYSSPEKDLGKLKNLFLRSLRKVLRLSLWIFVFYLIIAVFLAKVLNISYALLAITGLIIFLALFSPVTRGILQAKQRFKSLGLNMIIEASIKLVMGIVFVYFGATVFGAMTGVILGGLIALLFSFAQLRDIIKAKEVAAKTDGLYNYARPAFFITAIVIVFYSLDVIIAKIVFPPETAGAYAIASILGKILFWGTLPISKAMLPVSSVEIRPEQKVEKHVLRTAVIIISIGIFIALTLFYLFPEMIINIFSGKNVSDAAKILFIEGLAFSFIAITNLILIYKLSINALSNYAYLSAFLIVEVILLSYFSANVIQFAMAFGASSLIFLLGTIMLLKKSRFNKANIYRES
ncbi:MAG: oligosaccharide flippase family protein [Nanoarchaeota archaeon]